MDPRWAVSNDCVDPVGPNCGAVAQMGERRVRNAKVGSSILLGSTKFYLLPQARVDTSGSQSMPIISSCGMWTHSRVP